MKVPTPAYAHLREGLQRHTTKAPDQQFADRGPSSSARPEGFEPPTFWLVANAGDPVSVTPEPISPANVDNRPIADVIPLAGRRAKPRAA